MAREERGGHAFKEVIGMAKGIFRMESVDYVS